MPAYRRNRGASELMQSAVDLGRAGLPSKMRRMSQRRAPPWLVTAAVLVALFALLPLAFIIWIAVQTGWETVSALVFRPRVGELLVNTTLLVLLTVPIAIILSVALAWLTERSDLPGARLWAWLCVALSSRLRSPRTKRSPSA